VQAGEAGGLAPEGRVQVLGLHQLPVRPVTQNGQHASAVVATATSLANAYGAYVKDRRLYRDLGHVLRIVTRRFPARLSTFSPLQFK